MLDSWATIGVFVATQVITLVWVLATNKADSRSLRTEMSVRMDAMQNALKTMAIDLAADLKSMNTVLVAMADFKGELGRVQDRLMMQGARLDQVGQRLNDHIDQMNRRPGEKRPGP